MNLNALKPSVSMEILRIATEMKGRGIKVYSLSVGDTHFDPPADLRNRMSHLPKGYSHYTVGQGLLELRKEISECNLKVFDASEILVTPGLKQGLYYVMMAIEAKKLCVLEPAWLGYKALAQITGKEYIPINTQEKNWLDALERLEFDILILCSPNNPDGKIWDKQTVEQFRRIALKKDAWIVTDEIYDLYDYTETPGENAIKKLHDYEKIVVGSGLSKSHAMTGFRLGYLMTRSNGLIQKMNNIHQNLATCAPAVSQYFSIGFSNLKDELTVFKDYYRINRDLVSKLMQKARRFKPDGGFYYFIDLKDYGILNGDIFCKELLENKSVALVPGSAYGTGYDSFIRLSFSIDRAELENALPLIDGFINEYDKKH
jgi:aspartate/methionine/tyrosine aminotransferase